MSYTTLIVFDKDGTAHYDSVEFKNASGLAVMIWNAVIERYWRVCVPDWPILKPIPYMFEALKSMWEPIGSGKVKLRPWEALCWRFTLDWAIASDLLGLADAMDRFEDAHSKPDYVCHLTAVAKRLRELHAEGFRYAALYANSVGDCLWVRYESGENEDGSDWERTVAYNLHNGTEGWFIEKETP